MDWITGWMTQLTDQTPIHSHPFEKFNFINGFAKFNFKCIQVLYAQILQHWTFKDGSRRVQGLVLKMSIVKSEVGGKLNGVRVVKYVRVRELTAACLWETEKVQFYLEHASTKTKLFLQVNEASFVYI